MSILNITLFAASLLLLLLLMCAFTPIEGLPHLSQELALNQTISQPELVTTLNESVESTLNQPSPASYDPLYDISEDNPGTLDFQPELVTTINESVESTLNQPSPASCDPLYDISENNPGTLDLTPRRCCLLIMCLIFTPSTTSASAVTIRAGAASIATLLNAALIIGSYLTSHSG